MCRSKDLRVEGTSSSAFVTSACAVSGRPRWGPCSRRLKQLAAIVVTALVVVGVMVAVDRGGSVQPTVADTQAVSVELAGVPQVDMTLGEPDAAVTINEYGDLQCTACSAFATGILPAVIDKLVKTGAAKLSFHNWTIIDQTDSVAAAEASSAAGRQGRAWDFFH